ncbi:DUF2239 family protein [Inquilinus sp. CAU 1745]|uniref:DUF2239 family protein n=1 Tax=Inquilinus sp. CAU 1745 TaxID=3140369 RepID=UPI00325A7ED0
MDLSSTYTAFEGDRRIVAGRLQDVALALRKVMERADHGAVLTFDDNTGRSVDFDLRGTDEEVIERFSQAGGKEPPPRSPGRPKLGVVAREVTLLPRHWDWLASQPGGASATLRRLVETARAAGGGQDRARRAMEASDRFMSAMAGNRPGYEEAARALYAGDGMRFDELLAAWPTDVRDHARALAAPAFTGGMDDR